VNTPEVIYGLQPVLEALRADNVALVRVCLGRGDAEATTISALARARNVPVVRLSPQALTRMTGTSKHQGVAAMQSARTPYDLETLLAQYPSRNGGSQADSEHASAPFLFVLDGVEDPRNLGAIIRTADAAGADGVVIPNRRAAGMTGVVAKTSAGALAHLPVVRVTNISSALDRLKQENIWVVGLSASATTSYWNFDFTLPVALALGGEGEGLHQKVQKRCDALVSIPMRGHVASLNVSVAAALVAYEVVRQRTTKRPACPSSN